MRDDYAGWKSWRKTGNLFNVDMCYRRIPDILDPFDYDTFEKDPMDFWVCATDIISGKPTFHKLKNGRGIDMEWIRASASIPIFAQPLEINGHYYWDGGVSDSIPIDFFPRFSPTKQVVITTQPRNYRKNPKKNRLLYRQLFKKNFPAVYNKLKTRAVDYNAVIEEMIQEEEKGEILIIAPPKPINVKTIKNSPIVLQKAYDMGVHEGIRYLNKVKDFLQ
ncbi:patatin family protein [Lactobacillus sp.]|uniref:patatin-like phospholipase family protein n=1 Tax=Lactobacillus sp. TaxID=1591 RepID=UPI0025B926C0|nr:patatin family protein [Lactobacillus sp.]